MIGRKGVFKIIAKLCYTKQQAEAAVAEAVDDGGKVIWSPFSVDVLSETNANGLGWAFVVYNEGTPPCQRNPNETVP
jgi:hypothetical protein